jgi:hypothetical protein
MLHNFFANLIHFSLPEHPRSALCLSTPPPQVTELLLQYGADPAEPNPRGSTALDMGANQGSWRECHVMLRDFPDLPERMGKPAERHGYEPGETEWGGLAEVLVMWG